MKRILFASIVAITLAIAAAAPAGAAVPYMRQPGIGDQVRFDGSVGGEKSAWGYLDQQWLDAWLRFTIEASGSPKAYEAFRSALDGLAEHVSVLPNGTHGSVEDVKQFHYRDHDDVEVRVQVAGGKLNGAEVWTTPSELVDSSGKSYLRR